MIFYCNNLFFLLDTDKPDHGLGSLSSPFEVKQKRYRQATPAEQDMMKRNISDSIS